NRSGSSSSNLSAKRTVPQNNPALFKAVESSNLAEVRTALAAGADPNARKKVSISCFVFEGSKWSTSLFSKTPTEKPVGSYTMLNATTHGESALAMAIMQGNVELVRLLLDNGADPTLPIEWKIIRGRNVWTQSVWQNVIQRGTWDITYTFGSALELAIGEGVASDPMGQTRIESMGSTSRELWINKKGFFVLHSNPGAGPSDEKSFQTIEFTPDLRILDLLLQHTDVHVTPTLRPLITSCANHPDLLRKLQHSTGPNIR
ncbi:hypothetical protein HDU93_006799, partial [Gonapodya sp. JEL0774]